MAEPTKLESALDELLAGKTTEEIVGPDGLLNQRFGELWIQGPFESFAAGPAGAPVSPNP